MMNRGRLARSAMSLLLVGCVLLSVNALGQRHPASSDGSLGLPQAPRIVNNDNTRPAGRLEGEVLAVRMVAELGSWQPEGPRGATLKIAAFGADGGKLSVPGPLLRVREGATIAVTLRNALPADLRVAGFCSRPGKCDAVTVPAGAKREFRFGADAPGTYFYWASTASSTLPRRSRFDGQLGARSWWMRVTRFRPTGCSSSPPMTTRSRSRAIRACRCHPLARQASHRSLRSMGHRGRIPRHSLTGRTKPSVGVS
jgi:hypothetical protein